MEVQVGGFRVWDFRVYGVRFKGSAAILGRLRKFSALQGVGLEVWFGLRLRVGP